SSRTYNHPGAYATMQGDGNLVVYSSAGAPLWYSGTSGNPGATTYLQDDGNIVIYARIPSWSSNTAGS
ncbi:bacteriocin, partial [Pseudomonas sp. SIMBA_044]